MEPDPEVLTREPVRRLPRRATAVLVVLALLVLAVAWRADADRRADEDRALAACRTDLASAAHSAQSRLGAMAEYIRPTLSGMRGDRARALADLMRRPARGVVPSVRSADAACRRVEVLAWHTTTRARRDATIAYAAALLARLEAVAVRGETWFRADDRLDRLAARAGLSPA